MPKKPTKAYRLSLDDTLKVKALLKKYVVDRGVVHEYKPGWSDMHLAKLAGPKIKRESVQRIRSMLYVGRPLRYGQKSPEKRAKLELLRALGILNSLEARIATLERMIT